MDQDHLALSRAGDVLAAFEHAPFVSFEHLTRHRSILVIAPHADDETLGCGGLIAEACSRGVSVCVAVLTDGTRSHLASPSYPPERVAATREAEIVRALAELGEPSAPILFLRNPDGFLASDGIEADRIVADLDRFARLHDIGVVFVTWGSDDHPDHRAAAKLVRKWMATRPDLAVYAYQVWGWTLDHAAIVDAETEKPRRYDMARWRETKLRAVYAHRSQTGDLITDDPDAFRLEPAHLAMFCRNYEVFVPMQRPAIEQGLPEPREQSIATDHFDRLYAESDDPWGYTEHAYEKATYVATLEALPRARYARGFELGCSIGVLTRELAERCDQLIAVDCSAAAVEKATKRVANMPNVAVRHMRAPAEMPDGRFDLIVLSEVLYFLSRDDHRAVTDYVLRSIEPAGTCMIVNYLGDTESPWTGNGAAEAFIEQASPFLTLRQTKIEEGFRLDMLEPAAGKIERA